MNRVTVITIALAILLAHALAIHQSADGSLAPPYEMAHVAYRVARNIVHHGTASWIPGWEAVESYPSPLWVALSYFPERVYVSPTVFAQSVGVVMGLLTVVLLAQFSPKRMAGLIAPLLLAASGSAASAAYSGTEAGLSMLLVTWTFLAFERRWPRALCLASCLLALARPEAGYFLIAVVLLERRAARRSNDPAGRSLLPALVPVVAVLGLTSVIRWVATGSPLSPYSRALFAGGSPGLGAAYVWSFLTRSGTGPLVLVPAIVLAAGTLSGVGRRALVLSGVWFTVVLLAGGDELPMWSALTPILPLFYLSIQEAFRDAIDAWPGSAPAWTGVLALAVLASFFVSKVPGDIGPLPLKGLQERWLSPPAAMAEAYPRPLGRMGLVEEIRDVERLRALSLFIRDNARDPSVVLSLWPGAMGYLSRKPVLDVLGRAYPPEGSERNNSWSGRERVDLVAAVQAGPDYVVPFIDALGDGRGPLVLLGKLLDELDVVGNSAERLAELVAALRNYEMIAVPVPDTAARPGRPSPSPFFLLRRRDPHSMPTVHLARAGDEFVVQVRHEGPMQVVDLEVWTQTPSGERLTLLPTGEFVAGRVAAARTDILLFATGQRAVELVRQPYPDVPRGTEIQARLVNPGLVGERALVVTGRSDSLTVPGP